MCGLKSRAKQYGGNFIHALQDFFLDSARRNTHLLFFFLFISAAQRSGTLERANGCGTCGVKRWYCAIFGDSWGSKGVPNPQERKDRLIDSLQSSPAAPPQRQNIRQLQQQRFLGESRVWEKEECGKAGGRGGGGISPLATV